MEFNEIENLVCYGVNWFDDCLIGMLDWDLVLTCVPLLYLVLVKWIFNFRNSSFQN